ncbi:hypothetical protein [Paraburkholderia humisilvae]|uniref:Uncharacterized protein n=1 Tax=Paraburkholderia humisilvae TaxID=627669 RepID=A0A6J5ERQ0_9BURK|nr:hypothetical protein [Paraburkholderia humisilvae]CAB3769238.1 hypothetical protein LMG29542_06068 [Paraburkholderia humisilvae]
MYITVAVFAMFAVLLVFICFWRELSPGIAWLALQYHTTPEVLATLYTGGDTHEDDAQRRAAALSEQALRVAQAPLVEPEIRAGIDKDLRDRAHAQAAASGKTDMHRAGMQRNKGTASV